MNRMLFCAFLAIGTIASAQDIVESRLAELDDDLTVLGQNLGGARQGGLVTGAELTLLRVYGADRVVVGDDNASGPAGARVLRYDNLESGVRAWIGYESPSGPGVRARYWWMSAKADPLGPIALAPPNDTDTVQGFVGGTQIETFDLECTQNVAFRSWSFLLSGGIRRGKVESVAAMGLEDGGPPPVNDFLVTHFQHFYGWGPTFGVESKRSYANTGLNVFHNFRSSILFGERSDAFFGNGGLAGTPVEISAVVPVVESQLGVEWNPDTSFGLWTVRAAFEGQVWTNMRSPMNDAFQSGMADGRFPANDNLGLIGIIISAGYNW